MTENARYFWLGFRDGYLRSGRILLPPVLFYAVLVLVLG